MPPYDGLMSLLQRAARALSRVFPKHVRVLSLDLEAYPLATDTRVVMTLAQQDALAYAHLNATPERTLLAALENDLLVQKLAERPAFGLEPMREALLLALARPDVVAEARAKEPSPRNARVLAHALERMRRHLRTTMTLGDLLAAIASTEGEASRLLAPLALDFAAFDSKLVEPLAPAAGADDARVSVWALDDTTSRMDDVMRILEQGFRIPVRRAWHVMMTTHHEGQARVGTYPRAEAEAHIARAKSHADARKTPLRFHVGKA